MHPWNDISDVQPSGEGDTGNRVVAARLFTRNEAGRKEIISVGLEAVKVACKQTFAKNDERTAKTFVEQNVGRVERHEIFMVSLTLFSEMLR